MPIGNHNHLGTEKLPDGKIIQRFLKIKYRKGYVFIHNQPQVFTNHALLSEQSSASYIAHFVYSERQACGLDFVQGQTSNLMLQKRDRTLGGVQVSGITGSVAFARLWFVAIYLFNSKRRQRIVPVIKPLRNTTVEFVQTIGNLYYQQGNTANVIDKKIVFSGPNS